MKKHAPDRHRTHVVLVPGFAGFDALGQIEYYVGVNHRLTPWNEANAGAPLTLHYFDNLPTAGVATRAERLVRYLLSRIERHEFRAGDRVVLVGHSTGGLDIRGALAALIAAGRDERDAALRDKKEALLSCLVGVVFLSVPQYGTNTADCIAAHSALLGLATTAMAGAVALDPLSLPARATRALVRFDSRLMTENLLLAVRDALAETDEHAVKADPVAAADAREAYAHLLLWSRHMAHDLGSVYDLTSRVPRPAVPLVGHHDESRGTRSPAHFDEVERARERAAWARHGIDTFSVATRAPSPFADGALDDAAPFHLADPRTWPVALDAGPTHSDLIYRLCYRACVRGPFAPAPGADTALSLWDGAPVAIAAGDNDGIVNTASMLWPDGDATRLVQGDHGDVIGHFKLQETGARRSPARRAYSSYDLFVSGAGFDARAFEKVWTTIFDFCKSCGRIT